MFLVFLYWPSSLLLFQREKRTRVILCDNVWCDFTCLCNINMRLMWIFCKLTWKFALRWQWWWCWHVGCSFFIVCFLKSTNQVLQWNAYYLSYIRSLKYLSWTIAYTNDKTSNQYSLDFTICSNDANLQLMSVKVSLVPLIISNATDGLEIKLPHFPMPLFWCKQFKQTF